MEGVRTTVVESWPHLCDLLFQDSWRPDLGRHRSPFAFKGLGRADYPLTTSLQRLGGNLAAIEGHLLRNFRKYAIRSVDTPLDGELWNWLALAQHHGLPTRLLDWSYSPFVALHFATIGGGLNPEDAAVMAINFIEVHRRLPSSLRNALNEVGGDVWTAEALEKELPSLAALEALGDHEPVLFFFEPPALDQRILNQYAFFSVLSHAGANLQSYLNAHPDLAFRVVIPKALRQEIRDKLDQANVNERVLFPGLDGLSRWLARHYAPIEAAPKAENATPGTETQHAAGR